MTVFLLQSVAQLAKNDAQQVLKWRPTS